MWIPKFTKKRWRFENFHPLRGKNQEVNLFQLEKAIKDAAEFLPDTDTNENIDLRWDKIKGQMKAMENN